VIINETKQEAAISILKEIVDKFNTDFEEWSRVSGCVVTFGWKYGGEGRFVKALDVQGVDAIVWRKPPPEEIERLLMEK